MALDLRVAENEQDAVLVFRAYKEMHDEGLVPGAFHALKVFSNVMRLIRGPGSVVLMAMDRDELAGVLSLYEEAYWYSEEKHLIDKGLYVRASFRNGEASKVLLQAAKQTSDDLKIPCFLNIFNAKRKRGASSKTGWERIGATLGYDNRGAVLAHFPET